MSMTPTEEASLRLALAEREKRLANALTSTTGYPYNIPAMRAGIERLRRELDESSHVSR